MLGCEWFSPGWEKCAARHCCQDTGTLESLNTMPSNNAKESLRQFISVRPLFFFFLSFFICSHYIPDSLNPQRDPNALYSFDSERDASQSEICRQRKNKECIIVGPFRSRKKTSPSRRLVDTSLGGKKAPDDLQGVVCCDAGQ